MNPRVQHAVAKAIAVLSIISSMASILGFVALLQTTQTNWESWLVYLSAAGFAVALLLALYTMFAPSSAVVHNVEAKLVTLPEGARFVSTSHPRGTGVELLQQGDAAGVNGDHVVIEFPTPFAEPPKFELASSGADALTVGEVSAYFAHVTVARHGTWGTKTFTWFAKGLPLYNVKVVEVKPAGGKVGGADE
jgi:hypothetical protein